MHNQLESLGELYQRRPGSQALFDPPVATARDCLARLDALTGALDHIARWESAIEKQQEYVQRLVGDLTSG